MSTREIAQLEQRLYGLTKRLPGKQRIWELQRIGDELAIEADCLDGYMGKDQEAAALRKDALFLQRLAFDLMDMRDHSRGNPERTALYPEGRKWTEPKEHKRP